MKLTKILLMVLSLNVIYHFASAQNCQQGKVLMSKGAKGHCGCKCQKKCVPPGEVQAYLDDGWYYGECIDFGYFCCWVRNANSVNNTETMLTEIHPDPVLKAVTISFNLSKQSEVSLRVYDITGRYVSTVANKVFKENSHEVTWNSSGVNPGIYFLKMTAGEYNETRKIAVLN